MDALVGHRRDQLDRGQVLVDVEPVSGFSMPRTVVYAVVEAPPERVWRLIDAVADYARTMSGVKEAMELSRQPTEHGERVRARVTVKLPFPLKDLSSINEALHTVVPGQSYCREWQLVEGDYAVNSGSWKLTPFAGDASRTLVVYTLLAEPNIPIPKAIQGLAQKKALPKLSHPLI
jgi:ribosome-associated toxin RatA of RatAB toxin-antitoxin module